MRAGLGVDSRQNHLKSEYVEVNSTCIASRPNTRLIELVAKSSRARQSRVSQFCVCREQEACAVFLRGGPGGVPQPEPRPAEVPAGDQAAAAPHHGVHTPPSQVIPVYHATVCCPALPQLLSLLRHVAPRLPGALPSHRARPAGQ